MYSPAVSRARDKRRADKNGSIRRLAEFIAESYVSRAFAGRIRNFYLTSHDLATVLTISRLHCIGCTRALVSRLNDGTAGVKADRRKPCRSIDHLIARQGRSVSEHGALVGEINKPPSRYLRTLFLPCPLPSPAPPAPRSSTRRDRVPCRFRRETKSTPIDDSIL